MTCAMVLYFDQPFEQVDAGLGLTKSAEIRMQRAAPKEDIYVLVTRGFENIGPAEIQRLADLKYRVVDASAARKSVKDKYAFANDPKVWRGEDFHEMCFLRWLVLQEYFANAPVLTMDADMVWLMDPYPFFEKWKEGGSTLCFNAPCFTFIKGESWYDAYKWGLQQCSENPDFGNDFARDHYTGIYHDQALLQYLTRRGELENDTANLVGHGFDERYLFSVNPLTHTPERGAAPLTFERKDGMDIIGGKVVPFYHMQSRFARYLWTVKFVQDFGGHKNVRVPYGKPARVNPDVTGLVLNNLHQFIRRGDVSLNHKRHRHLEALTSREGIYGEFFDGDLARETFRDEVWWSPGVWAPMAEQPA